MNDEEFDQVPQILFNNVSSLVQLGSPGTLIPLTKDTRAVLCGNRCEDVIIVAARFGEGRCLVFGQNAYLNLFTKTDEYKDQAIFINNCKQWLSKGLLNEIVEINNEKTILNMATQDKILVWNGHKSKDDKFITDLCKYLQSGGALICGATTWGWLQVSKGKDLSDFSFAHFCDNIGVKLTNSVANTANPIVFRSDLINFKNISQTVENLNKNPSNKELLSIIGRACKEIDDILPGTCLQTFKTIVINAEKEIIPVKKSPIKDEKYREQSKGLCGIMHVLSDIKAPGIHSFPGDFDQSPQIETNVLCTIESTAKEWHCTGYYVAAGIPIQIDIIKQEGVSGWCARIGCHSDDLRDCNELRRWPCILTCKSLTTGTITLNSAFGGLLFLESPEGGSSSSITINIHNVVLTPTYNLLDSNRADLWKYKQENAQGLWADISGQYIVFNLPSKSVLNFDSTLLDRVLHFWDSVVLAHHELLGTQPTYRERVVCDEQISGGYMHCGYPVVTHLDIGDPQSKSFIFNIDILEKQGAWGLFHELGHNRQRSWWTFDGTTEVTVNIFTLHAMDKICHLQPWIHSWLKDQIESTKKYIENGSKFTEWKQKPGVALFIYAQLVREYGWDSYKAVFRKYEKSKPVVYSNEEKINYWIITFSRQVGHNLAPLFKFWGFPVTQQLIDFLNVFEVPTISDIFIDLAPERYNSSA